MLKNVNNPKQKVGGLRVKHNAKKIIIYEVIWMAEKIKK